MRRYAVVAALLTACGGSPTDTVDPTPPPPPPPVLVPAAITVTVGDGQQGEPGSIVAVKPVVVVKDASGRNVPGASVSFAIDSGGGTLVASVATTATDGTASPGDWRLGSAETRNVIRASVGTLTPAKIVATAVIVPVTLVDQSVGTGGGTVTVNRPGSPVNGLTVVLAPGAFPTSQTIGISYASSAGFPVPNGAAVISPLITFRTSDGGLATKPMLITIPAAVPAGAFPVIVLRDAATGRREVLTTVAHSATSVTGMTGHLNGARLMGADGSFVAGAPGMNEAASLRDPAGIGTAAVVALPASLLDADHDTGFRPGVDSWEFRPLETIVPSNGFAAIVATAAWYYIAQKTANGALWKKYQEAEGVEESNRRGFRWTAMASEIFGGQFTSGLSSIAALLRGMPLPGDFALPAKISISSFNAVRTALTVSPGAPQLAILSTADDGTGVPVLIYRSTGQKLFAVDPGNPAQTVTLDFTSGFMAPVTLTGSTLSYRYIFASGFSLLATTSVLQSQWPLVVAGTIGNGVFPTYQGKVAWGNEAGKQTDLKDPVYVFADTDPMHIWLDCITCVGMARPSAIPPGTARIAGVEGFSRVGASGPFTLFGTGNVFVSTMNTPGDRRMGVAVYALRTSGDSELLWVDWIGFTLRRLAASIAPAAPTNSSNTDITLTLTVTGAPGNLEYEWDFADLTARAVTTTPVVTHKWALAGTYVVKVTARDKTTKQPVAKASVTTVIKDATRWRLATFQQTSLTNSFPASLQPAVFWENALTMNEIRDSLITRVAGGIIEVLAGGRPRPDGFVQPNSGSYRAAPSASDTAIYLTFPRGVGVLAEALAGRGVSVAPTLPLSTFYPHKPFTNTYAKTSGPVTTITGTAANWVAPVNRAYACTDLGGTSPGNPGTSPTRGQIEFTATTTVTGLSGSITFITQVPWAEIQAVPTGCLWDAVGAIRRTFSFTAVTIP